MWKSGRGLLASSHAGTRLPIAVFGPDTGRSPSVRSRLGRDAGMDSPSFRSKESKKTADAPGHPPSKPCMNSLRWHYPHQVKGRSSCFLSARRLPCLLPYYGTGAQGCQGRFGQAGLDKRKAAAYTVPRKGVLGRGLRGGCIPSTSPDLGNANVGMRRKSDVFSRTGGVWPRKRGRMED